MKNNHNKIISEQKDCKCKKKNCHNILTISKRKRAPKDIIMEFNKTDEKVEHKNLTIGIGKTFFNSINNDYLDNLLLKLIKERKNDN